MTTFIEAQPMGAPTPFTLLRPLRRAQFFLERAQTHASFERSSHQESRSQLSEHVRHLNTESQYALLGLPEALVGLEVMSESSINPWIIELAEELAQSTLMGDAGLSELDSTEWTDQAISLHFSTQGGISYKIPTLSRDFFISAKLLTSKFPGLEFRETYGFIFAQLDTMDGIFGELDRLASIAGGMELLRHHEAQKGGRHFLMTNMIRCYASKHFRRSPRPGRSTRPSTNAIAEFFAISQALVDIFRLSAHDTSGRWSHPAYFFEELIRGLLEASLGSVRIPGRKHIHDFATHLNLRSKNPVPVLDVELSLFKGREFDTLRIPKEHLHHVAQWAHRRPEPCAEYGTSTSTILEHNSDTRPLAETSRNRFIVAPKLDTINYIWSLQKRLGYNAEMLGKLFEDFMVLELGRRFHVHRGIYSAADSTNETGEIDALVLSDHADTAIVFEFKATSERRDTWSGGYYRLADHFQRTFLKSQEQMLRFESSWRHSGSLMLLDKSRQSEILWSDSRRLLRVSVSLSNFGDAVHRPGFARALLSHALSTKIQYSTSGIATDSANRSDANTRKLQNQCVEHIQSLAPSKDYQSVVDNTLFVDFRILCAMIDAHPDKNGIVEKLVSSATRSAFSKVVVPFTIDHRSK